MHYDPAFAYEIAHIVQDGLRRMYGSSDEHPHGEDVIYYLTVYNEPTEQPAEPENLDVEGLLARHLPPGRTPPGGLADDAPRVQLLASGVGLPWIQRAQQLLADDWGVAADLWSVTSWNELSREALATEEWNLMHPLEEPRTPYVTRKLQGRRRPGGRGQRLHARRAADDLALGPAALPRARRRRVRLRRHPPGRAAVLQDRRRVGGLPGPGRRSPRRARSAATRCRRRSTTTGSTTRPRCPASSRRAATPRSALSGPSRRPQAYGQGASSSRMSRPTILTVDDDPQVSAALTRDLQARVRLDVPRAVGDVGRPGARAALGTGAARPTRSR